MHGHPVDSDSEKLGGIEHSSGRLMAYASRHYPMRIGLTVVCTTTAVVASAVGSIFMQQVVDNAVTPGLESGFDAMRVTLACLVVTMGIIFGAGIIAGFIYTRTMAIVTRGTLKHMRGDMFDSVERLPLQFFDAHPHSTIMSTFTNDADAIRQLIGQSIPTLIQSGLTVIVLIRTVLYYSIWLFLVALIVDTLMAFLTGKLGGLSGRFMKAQQAALTDGEGFIEEVIDGQKVVQVFNHEQGAKDEFVKYNQKLFDPSQKANIYSNVLMPTLGNIGNITYVIIAIVGGVMILEQTPNIHLFSVDVITVGVVVSFLGVVRDFSQAIGQMSIQVPMIAMDMAGAGRVFALIDQEPKEDEGYVTLVRAHELPDGTLGPTEERMGIWAWRHPHKADGTVTYTHLRGEFVVEDVDFSYDGERQILHDISLWAKSDQKIAFVGATDASKATITNLINRFYDIADGKIRYDGININRTHKPDLHHSLGIVLQDVELFTGIVMEGIRYGRLDATDEECIAAAKLTNTNSFIRRLPEDYDTVLTGNGSNLSQGQAQPLSAARIAVAGPPAMILDETISSIGTRTKALVQQGMDNLMEGHMVFAIAHRLSTVHSSDTIVVLDHGRVVGRGSHDDLIAQKDVYYQLYVGAFELE